MNGRRNKFGLGQPACGAARAYQARFKNHQNIQLQTKLHEISAFLSMISLKKVAAVTAHHLREAHGIDVSDNFADTL